MKDTFKIMPLWSGVLLAVAIGLLIGYWVGYDTGYKKTQRNSIRNFQECAAAGYPIQESLPEVCQTPDGKSFTNTKTEPSNKKISKEEALSLINGCDAVGTYSLHSGEIGLILKNGDFKSVTGVTEDYLRQNQNPACPFSRAAME